MWLAEELGRGGLRGCGRLGHGRKGSVHWFVETFAGVTVSATDAAGNTVAVSFGYGLLMGCVDDKLVDTNLILNLGLARGIS
mmetsp:Transcript_36788/g.118678  ORF Transcript_36788/g.118678 Transcript_36788/m.118678 type:complete len:82 (-) Transcript_36788:1420-1665(-)